MQSMNCNEVLEAVNGILIAGNNFTEFSNISADSRTIEKDELFIPIKGERFDGHDFIADAFKKGAAGTITHKDPQNIIEKNEELLFKDKTIIYVNDTKEALFNIASYYRRKFSIPFIGITGSVGKTSTKNAIACILQQKYNVLKTPGNFNNDIGVPLTVFKLEPHHEAAVFEMGMSAEGEIRQLTSIIKPDIGVITNIGITHIEKLGSRQNILKAKLEIIESMDENGLLVLNGDDDLLYGLKDSLDKKVIYFGISNDVDYKAYNIKNAGEAGIYFDINIKGEKYNIHVPTPGMHNIYNILAGIIVGIEMGLSAEQVIEGVKNFKQDRMRLNIIEHNNVKIIDDTYNASPQSMEAALRLLNDINTNTRRIAVLGDMLELGDWAFASHYNIGKLAFLLGIDYILAVGQYSQYLIKGAIESGADFNKAKSFSSKEEAIPFLKNILKEGDVVLIKGSRAMKMENVVSELTK